MVVDKEIYRMAGTLFAGREPPAIKFFEPNSRFSVWAKGYCVGHPVIDVGAGVGHVAKRLSRLGLKVAAIDISRRETPEFPVMIIDGIDFPYPKDSIVLICRPCHNGFVEHVIDQARARWCHSVVYVGKDANAEQDLGQYLHKFDLVQTNVGKEHESLYILE